MTLLFLALRFWRGSFSLHGILQDFAAGFLCSFFPIPFAILAVLDSCLQRNADTRLSLSHFAHVLTPKSYVSSLSAFSVWREILLFLLWLSFRPLQFDLVGIFGFSFLLLPSKPREANILFSLLSEAKRSLRRKPKIPLTFSIRGEEYQSIDPTYPLLRSTLSFHGAKTFHLRIAPHENPHVLFVFLESFRAKDVGALGAKASLSPCFDALAKKGILFSQFHANGTRTSHASLASLYGVPPATTPSYLHFYLDIPLIGLPHLFKGRGYETCLIQGGHLTFCRTGDFFRSHGFDTLFGRNDIGSKTTTSWGAPDIDTFRFAANWLQTREKPAFLSLFSITNHHPWRVPGSSKTGFSETFRYTDQALGILVEELQAKNLLEKTILFILGDHGQSQNERNTPSTLNKHLYQENIHVPLLIYAPSRIDRPRIIAEPSCQVDLLPTVVDLFQMQEPHHSMGRSLLREGSSDIFFNHPNDDPLIGKRSGNTKVILHPLSEKIEVYDLARDPGETKNLIRKNEALELLHFAAQLETLYREKKFAPSTPLDDSLRCSLHKRLDLTDTTVLAAIGPKPALLSLELAYCSLLTDHAIEQILQRYPHLEELDCEGIDELTGAWNAECPRLASINLFHSPKLQGAKIAPWLAALPQLWEIKLDSSNFTKTDFELLGNTKTEWKEFHLMEAHALDDIALASLFREQTELTTLTLDGAIFSNGEILRRLPIRFLKFQNCPFVTDETIAALFDLPLVFLAIENCPNFRGESLTAFPGQKEVQISPFLTRVLLRN